MAFRTYKLTDTQLKQLARLAVQEQGSLDGAKAELSLMANLLETSPVRQKKYGTDGDGLVKWVGEGGWFYRALYYMTHGSVADKYVEAARDVLCNGNRTLPQYVDEHDCFSDIKSISTGAITDRSAYIKGKTIIKNKMGSTYTFYCFPAAGSDPFGYTAEAYNYVLNNGGAVEAALASAPSEAAQEAPVEIERCSVSASVPVVYRDAQGEAVRVWQTIIGVTADGDFGPATQAATIKWQAEHGLTADGIAGTKTWSAALGALTLIA